MISSVEAYDAYNKQCMDVSANAATAAEAKAQNQSASAPAEGRPSTANQQGVLVSGCR